MATQIHCVTMNKASGQWVLLEWDRYEKTPEEYSAPLETVRPDQMEEAEYMVRLMNQNPRGANFWRFNAHKRVPTGGRLAYARIAMQMSDARRKEVDEDYRQTKGGPV